MSLDVDTIATKSENYGKALSENSLKTSILSRKIDLEPVNTKRMNEKEGKEFCSQYIIDNGNNMQDGLWLNESKNRLEVEKSEEKMLVDKDPLQEKIGIIQERETGKLSKQDKYILTLIDTLISTTTIGPLVIGFWRGTWGLMDLHWDMFPFWLCFTFGIATHTMFGFVKYQLCDHVNKKSRENILNRIVCQYFKTIYTYVFGIMCTMHWRGGWIILDKYLHIDEPWITASLTTSFLGALITLRCMRNLLAPPFVVAIDSYNHLFLFPSLCKRPLAVFSSAGSMPPCSSAYGKYAFY